MALLYFNNQLIATSSAPGVLFNELVTKPFHLKYEHIKGHYYTIIIFDDLSVHFLKINVPNNSLTKGEALVLYQPFMAKPFNYNGVVNIYQQPSQLDIPTDDFDMEKFIKNNQLILKFTIDFTVLQTL